MSLNDSLNRAQVALDEVRQLIDAGEPLTRSQVAQLEHMKKMVGDLRNYSICIEQAPNKVVARRWRLSEARVCQIRGKGVPVVFR
jgi:hypothetical protein